MKETHAKKKNDRQRKRQKQIDKQQTVRGRETKRDKGRTSYKRLLKIQFILFVDSEAATGGVL